MKTIVFLDLEDTVLAPVLTGWFNAAPVSHDKFDLVKEIVNSFTPDEVSIFSFAIWDEAQLVRFNFATRDWLENKIGHKFKTVLRVDEDIISACCLQKGISQDRVDFSEMSAFWGKHDAFRIFMRHFFKDRCAHDEPIKVVLIDDAVDDETFFWKQLNVHGEIINIDKALEAAKR